MIIVTMIILAFMCISQGLKKEYMSPLFIFPALWIVVLFLYNLRLYGIYEISLNTEVILFLGIIGFLIGATFFKYISIKPKHYLYIFCSVYIVSQLLCPEHYKGFARYNCK